MKTNTMGICEKSVFAVNSWRDLSTFFSIEMLPELWRSFLSFHCRTDNVVFQIRNNCKSANQPSIGTNSTNLQKDRPINNGPTKQPNKQQAVKPKVLGQHPTCRWHSAERRDVPPNSAPLKQQQLDLSQRDVHGSIEGWSYSHPNVYIYCIYILCMYVMCISYINRSK